MTAFDPEHAGFVRIDYAMGGIDFYEYRDHDIVDGRTDVMRLNIYMSRDHAFTCIWNGLLEPTFTQGIFALPPPGNEIDFNHIYFERLFRGYIETDEEAVVILRALRIDVAVRSLPQVLRGAPHDLRCEPFACTMA